MSFSPYFLLKPPYRIISFDGGGIFGYFTALMLRQLCEQNDTFLDGEDDTIFAGLSAGALSALLLAREERPRDAILRGDLERLFYDPRLYENDNPVTAITSIFGLTAWCSGPSMKELVQDFWGDTTLGEMPQRVLIETFDFTGKNPTNDERMWQPKTFRNFGRNNQADVAAAFVAYGATAPATYRPVDGGISDGGYFAINPVMSAVSQIIQLDELEERYWCILQRIYYQVQIMAPAYKALFSLNFNLGAALQYDTIRPILMEGLAVIRHEMNDLLELLGDLELRGYEGVNVVGLIAQLEEIISEGYFDTDYPVTYDVSVIELSQKNYHGFLDLWQNLVDNPIAPTEKVWTEHWEAVKHELADDLFGPGLKGETGGFFWLQNNPPPIDNAGGVNMLEDIAVGTLPQNTEGLYEALMSLFPARISDIQAFSMGCGNAIPGYCLENFNLGYLNINLIPTNIQQLAFLPPSFYLLLDPGLVSASQQAKQVLGENYMRFNPPMLKFPVPNEILSLYWSRFASLRKYILNSITAQAEKVTHAQYAIANHWLRGHEWTHQDHCQ